MKDFLHHLFLFSQKAKFSSHSSTAKVLSRLCVLLNQYFRFNLNKNGQKIFYLNPSAKNNVGTLRLVAHILCSKQRILCFLCFFSKENSLQRNGCKETKENFYLKDTIFGTNLLKNHYFWNNFLLKLTFPKNICYNFKISSKSTT